MEIISLGTSSGTPTKTRNVSATALKMAGAKSWVLVDCGEGTQHQLLRTPLSLGRLDCILITHVHGDHTFGLPGLLASASLAGRKKTLRIIGSAGLESWLKSCQDMSETYLSYGIEFIDVATVKNTLRLKHFNVDVHPLSHRVPSYAYSFIENQVEQKIDIQKLNADGIPAGPIWGQIQKGENIKLTDGSTLVAQHYMLPDRKPRKVIISGDNDQPHLLKSAAMDCDVLMHESTFTAEIAEKVGPQSQHSYAQLVAEFAEQAHIKHLILTHFSARYLDYSDAVNSINDIENEAKKYFSGTLFLARDFDCFELDSNGELKHTKNLRAS